MILQPRVSFLIPHFNHGKCITEAINSILNQDFTNYEIIIVDDASTDDSFEILQDITTKDSRVKLFQNEQNQGTEITLNRCIELANGEFIICRAADDLCAPKFLNKAVELLDIHQSAGMCVGDVEFIDDDKNPSGVESLNLSKNDRFFTPDEIIHIWKSDYNIPAASAIYRKSTFIEAGTYLKGLRWYSDWMLNMIVTFRTGLIYCPQVFAQFRLDSGSYGNSRLLDYKAQENIFYYVLKYLKNDFRDVLPAFMRSGALDLFAPRIVDTYYQHPDLWSIELLNALQKPIYTWNKSKESFKDNHGIGKNIRTVIQKHKNSLRQLFTNFDNIKIAIYGAGLHTEKLLNIWNEFNFPEISFIVISDQPNRSHFNSIPLANVHSLKNTQPDLILLSSQSFEDAMAETTQQLFPKQKVLSFWKEKYIRL